MTEVIVVQSKVKDVIKNTDMNMAGDFAEALSKRVEAMVKDACKRANENGRKTVRGYDL